MLAIASAVGVIVKKTEKNFRICNEEEIVDSEYDKNYQYMIDFFICVYTCKCSNCLLLKKMYHCLHALGYTFKNPFISGLSLALNSATGLGAKVLFHAITNCSHSATYK